MATLRPISATALAALLLGAGLAAPAGAQTALPTFSIEGNALYNTFQGRGLQDVADGAGFEVLGNVGVGAFSLGAGYVRTTHDVVDLADDAELAGPFVEPRLALPFYYRSFTPYLSGRIAHLTERASAAGGDRTATGTQLGGGVGMLVALAPGVRLNMGLTYANLRMRDAEQGGTRIPGSGGEGASLGFRAGLSIGGAGWGVH